MIVNNTLTHEQFQSSLDTWVLDSNILNAFLIAFLSTVLSYQATSIFFDLLLGLKERGNTSAADVQIKLLADEPFPLAILSAILRRDKIDLLRFRVMVPHGTTLPRSQSQVQSSVVAKLVILVFAAPLFNLLAVTLTFEADEKISFKRANFPGVALGYIPGRGNGLHSDSYKQCSNLNIQAPKSTRRRAEFMKCPTVLSTKKAELHREENEIWVSVTRNYYGRVGLQVHCPRRGNKNALLSTDFFGTLQNDDGVYRIEPVLDVEDAKKVIDVGMGLVERDCPPSGKTEVVEEYDVRQRLMYNVSRGIRCSNFDDSKGWEMIAVMATSVDFIEVGDIQNDFRVKLQIELPPPDQSFEFEPAGDLNYLSRRSKFVSQGMLCVVVPLVLLLRVIIRSITQNDVDPALEAILKTYCQVPICRSLLSERSSIRYDYTYRLGNLIFYGLPNPKLGELQEFRSSVERSDMEESGSKEDSLISSADHSSDSEKCAPP